MEARHPQKTIIIPMGLLQELNHLASGAEFIQLSQGKLTPQKLNALMPQILAHDTQMKMGLIQPKDFRKAVLDLFEFTLEDAVFDAAWNKMLGRIQLLLDRLQELKTQYPDVNFILINKTNPIHFKHTYKTIYPERLSDEEKMENPVSIAETPIYLSFLCADYQNNQNDIVLYQQVFNTQKKLDPKHTTIVLQLKSQSPYSDVKARDEAIAKDIQKWGTDLGMHIMDRKPGESILDTLARDQYERKLLSFLKTPLHCTLWEPTARETPSTKNPSGYLAQWPEVITDKPRANRS